MATPIKSILIIEDEPDLCRNLSYRLQKQGYETLCAYDGESGLTQLKELKPDFVILDLMLPGMGGEEVCKAIRESGDASIQDIPILVLTAKDFVGEKNPHRVSGATAYMTKPYEFDYLLQEIRKCG